MIDLTRQAATSHWGWTIAFFLWFVGLAGMGLFLNYWLKSKRVFFICTVSAILGTLLVVSHLARMLNLPMAVINSLLEWKFNFTSWMFLNILINTSGFSSKKRPPHEAVSLTGQPVSASRTSCIRARNIS